MLETFFLTCAREETVPAKKLSNVVLDVLAKIDFAKRYYGYVKKHPMSDEDEEKMSQQEAKQILTATLLSFSYDKRERFYSCVEVFERGEVTLIAKPSQGDLELVLNVKLGKEQAGGPFSMLALNVARLRDPKFNPSPAYPDLVFHNADELAEAVSLGVALFKDFKREFLAHLGTRE